MLEFKLDPCRNWLLGPPNITPLRGARRCHCGGALGGGTHGDHRQLVAFALQGTVLPGVTPPSPMGSCWGMRSGWCFGVRTLSPLSCSQTPVGLWSLHCFCAFHVNTLCACMWRFISYLYFNICHFQAAPAGSTCVCPRFCCVMSFGLERKSPPGPS